MSPIEFENFVRQNIQLIIDSNNNLETLEKSKNDFEKIKPIIDSLNPNNISFSHKLNIVLELGFARVNNRKIEELDTSCPFSQPF